MKKLEVTISNKYSFGEGEQLQKTNFLKQKLLSERVASITMMLSLILILIGTTYGLLQFMNKSDANIIKTGQVSMSYTESNNIINITNALPITDEEGKNSSTYFDFTIMSNAKTNANDNEGVSIPYNLILQEKGIDTSKVKLTTNQIKVYLTKVENGIETQVLAPTLISKLSKLEENYHLYTTENIHKNNNGTVTTNYRLRA